MQTSDGRSGGRSGAEWRRSWWIALTLFPFGWLSFVAFLYAGRRTQRRDWLLWGIAYLVIFWTATVIASVEELGDPVRQAAGVVLLFGMPFPLVHALRIRRPYLEATDSPAPATPAPATPAPVPPASEAPVAPGLVRPEVPRVEGWTRSRFWGPAGIVFLALFGMGTASGGLEVMANGDPAGLALAAAGFTMMVMLPLFHPGARPALPVTGAVPGTSESGLLFPLSLVRLQGTVLAAGLFAVATAAIALWPDSFASEVPETATRALAAAATLVLGGVFLANVSSFRGGCLALTPAGVAHRRGKLRTFVPWDSIVDVRATEMSIRWPVREQLIGVFVSDRRVVDASGAARFFRSPGRRRPNGHVTYSARMFESEPAWILETLVHYREHPEERADLGKPDAVATFERLRAAPPSDSSVDSRSPRKETGPSPVTKGVNDHESTEATDG